MVVAPVLERLISLFEPEDSRQAELQKTAFPLDPAQGGRRGFSAKAVFWAAAGIGISLLLGRLV